MYNHEEIASTLRAFHETMKEAGFTEDQAFQLTRDYFMMSMDNEEPTGNDTYNPYDDPYDDTP